MNEKIFGVGNANEAGPAGKKNANSKSCQEVTPQASVKNRLDPTNGVEAVFHTRLGATPGRLSNPGFLMVLS